MARLQKGSMARSAPTYEWRTKLDTIHGTPFTIQSMDMKETFTYFVKDLGPISKLGAVPIDINRKSHIPIVHGMIELGDLLAWPLSTWK